MEWEWELIFENVRYRRMMEDRGVRSDNVDILKNGNGCAKKGIRKEET
jgi:hypothetical protein